MTNRSIFQYWYKVENGKVVAHGKTKKSLTWSGTEKWRRGIYMRFNDLGSPQIIIFQHEAILKPPVFHTLKKAVANYWIEQDWRSNAA